MLTSLALLFSISLSASAQDMEYTEVCDPQGNCRKLSRLVMGTDHLIQGDWTGHGEPELTLEQAFQVFDAASKLGINFFDSSPIYVGGVEYDLGAWKKSRADDVQRPDWYATPRLNPDRRIYLLSKGGFPFDLYYAKSLEAGNHAPALIETLVKQGVLKSVPTLPISAPLALQNVPAGTYVSRLYGSVSEIVARIEVELGHTIGNDRGDIDVWLMHRDDGDAVGFQAVDRPKTPVTTILQALADPKLRPHYGLLGWSNWEPARIEESLQLAAANPKFPKPVINSPYFSLFEMSARTIHALGVQVTHDQMMDPGFLKGVKIMPYSPLGGFSILDRDAPAWETAKAAAKAKFEQGDAYWRNVYPSVFTAENEIRYHRVDELTRAYNFAHGTGYTIDQMINAYALAHPRTDLLAVGAITVEQVRRTVGALALSKKLHPGFLEYLYRGTAHAEVTTLLENFRASTCGKSFAKQ
jgi:aryl-alcohol dehydrogenase-like predicted oxidoreductase